MNKRTPNRAPYIVLGLIVLIAIIMKASTPPAPIVPGPKGKSPNWTSQNAVGTMEASSVNPAGTKWAGAWTGKDKDGKDVSAIWTIDFESQSNYSKTYKDKVEGIKWTADKAEPSTETFSADNQAIWYSSRTGSLVGRGNRKEAVLQTGDGIHYRFFDPVTEARKSAQAFAQYQLPGVIEGSWASPAGILLLCRHQDKFSEVVYNIKAYKLNTVGKDGFRTDVKANWPQAPKELYFVTYRGGFKLDIATGKTKKLFDYMSLGAQDDTWRSNIQDGRLYPRKDGGYTSVSDNGSIDIRVLDRKGMLVKNLLPRN